MTLTKSDGNDLLDAIRAGGDIDVVREGVESVQALIDAEGLAGVLWPRALCGRRLL